MYNQEPLPVERKSTVIEEVIDKNNNNLEALSEISYRLARLHDKLKLNPKEDGSSKEAQSPNDLITKLADQSSRFSILNDRISKTLNQLEELI